MDRSESIYVPIHRSIEHGDTSYNYFNRYPSAKITRTYTTSTVTHLVIGTIVFKMMYRKALWQLC